MAVKLRLRAFLAEPRDRGDTTLLLTTHDLGDVSALCPRVMLLAEGQLLHDGPLPALAARLGGRRSISVELGVPLTDDAFAALVTGLPSPTRLSDTALRLSFGAEQAAPDLVRVVLERAAALSLPVADLRIEDPPVEELVARYYEDRGRRPDSPEAAVRFGVSGSGRRSGRRSTGG